MGGNRRDGACLLGAPFEGFYVDRSHAEIPARRSEGNGFLTFQYHSNRMIHIRRHEDGFRLHYLLNLSEDTAIRYTPFLFLCSSSSQLVCAANAAHTGFWPLFNQRYWIILRTQIGINGARCPDEAYASTPQAASYSSLIAPNVLALSERFLQLYRHSLPMP